MTKTTTPAANYLLIVSYVDASVITHVDPDGAVHTEDVGGPVNDVYELETAYDAVLEIKGLKADYAVRDLAYSLVRVGEVNLGL